MEIGCTYLVSLINYFKCFHGRRQLVVSRATSFNTLYIYCFGNIRYYFRRLLRKSMRLYLRNCRADFSLLDPDGSDAMSRSVEV